MIGEISNMFKIEELLNKWDKNKPVSLRKIQEHAQCIRCINRNSERCKSKDKFLIRVCYDFIPEVQKLKIHFN